MLYLPDQSYQRRFLEATLPLPPKLLPYLYGKGLGIFVLPARRFDAYMMLHGHLGEDWRSLSFGREPCDTAHYIYASRRIIMPADSFYDDDSNVLLHEIGHAVDHLYLEQGWLTQVPEVVKALRPNKPLNPYCYIQDREAGVPLEQFATSFEALFTYERRRNNHEVSELSEEFVELAKGLFFERFQSV